MPKGSYRPARVLAEISRSARRLGLKARWLDRRNERLLQVHDGTRYTLFGSGWYAIWPFVSRIVFDVVNDKELTNRILTDKGITVPRNVFGYIDPTIEPAYVKDAVRIREAARRLPFGLPAVVKPVDGNSGQGISIVWRQRDIKRAIDIAQHYSNRIIIEEYIPGRDYRVYVLEGKVLLLVERGTQTIISDGTRTVREQVGELSWRRSAHDAGRALTVESFLAAEGKRVPPAGEEIAAYPVTNRVRGGTVREVSRTVSPDWGATAIAAARAAGAPFCAVDFRVGAQDEVTVIEVNGSPNVIALFRNAPREGRWLTDVLVKRAVEKYSWPL